MDITASPLVQQERPAFQPKIVSLYSELFQNSDDHPEDKSDGFWTEFFLLKPYPPGIKTILEPLSGDDLLQLQHQTQQLFVRAVACVKKGHSPSDEIAFDTLSAFLKEVLSKRYTNLSSDAIAVLAGLDRVDAVFTDFVHVLDSNIKNGRTVELRYKAVQVALVMACGGFHTGLLSYFTHRDLFPAIMKYINDPATSSRGFEPFVLLGVLANYNKFEFQNPYQLRLADFVNESAIRHIVYTIGAASSKGREAYIAIMDDVPENWNFGNVLNMVGLGGLLAATKLTRRPSLQAATKPEQNEEVQKASFSEFSRSMTPDVQTTSNKIEPPFATYLSFSSYLAHHAHRSSRASLYAKLNMLVLRVLVEDAGINKRLVSDELKTEVRFCRQRQPFLPLVRGGRTLMAAILDIAIDGISHNLRKKLDVDLYMYAQ